MCAHIKKKNAFAVELDTAVTEKVAPLPRLVTQDLFVLFVRFTPPATLEPTIY